MSLSGRDETVACSVVDLLCLNRCQVVDGFVRALGVKPGDPVQGLDLDLLDVAPGPVGSDELGLWPPPDSAAVRRSGWRGATSTSTAGYSCGAAWSMATGAPPSDPTPKTARGRR